MSKMQNAMWLMFNRAKPHLSSDELKTVSCLSEKATIEARRLSGLCEGLGCLIVSDETSGVAAGSFQCARSVSELLFSLSHSFDVIGSMVEVGDEAAHLLNERKGGKA